MSKVALGCYNNGLEDQSTTLVNSIQLFLERSADTILFFMQNRDIDVNYRHEPIVEGEADEVYLDLWPKYFKACQLITICKKDKKAAFHLGLSYGANKELRK